ncbi:hypothetical protein 010DV004_24 [Bacillus phage 010DV004]|nr:hypothetical protein 010DV004_24 [Bacillus phage 010DV004]QZA69241.1 hypothetical protein 010DV005_24 [Bacillus phage 010DV005]
MTERKQIKSVIPDWVREEAEKIPSPADMFWRILDNGAEVNNKRDWSIDAQINKRVEQYKKKYNKKPTYVVMSLPVHSAMMFDFRTAFEDEIVPAGYRMEGYNGLEVIVLEVDDLILLVG